MFEAVVLACLYGMPQITKNCEELRDIRLKRKPLLEETDFYANSDVTMSDDMRTYRQNLRDITNGLDTVEKAQNVTWPSKP